MTTNNFKKAIKNATKNYAYASEILKCMRIEECSVTGTRCGHRNAAIISVCESENSVMRWRVYYNYDTMKNEIGWLNFDECADACYEFSRFA